MLGSTDVNGTHLENEYDEEKQETIESEEIEVEVVGRDLNGDEEDSFNNEWNISTNEVSSQKEEDREQDVEDEHFDEACPEEENIKLEGQDVDDGEEEKLNENSEEF